MNIKRNKKNQVVVTLSSKVDVVEAQRALDYLQYLELTAGGKATQAQADALAAEAKANIRRGRRKKQAA